MIVHIETIPFGEPHRCGYASAGDWWWEGEVLQVRVTAMGDPRKEWAIAAHETDEAITCKRLGITEAQVCEFDSQYEKEREQGLHKEMDEPGDDPRSPYREPHMRATHVERAVCHSQDVLWDQLQGDVEAKVL